VRTRTLFYRNNDTHGLTYVRWRGENLIISFREGGHGPFCLLLYLKWGFVPTFIYVGTFMFGRTGPELRIGRP
jgi:hypothetical protein